MNLLMMLSCKRYQFGPQFYRKIQPEFVEDGGRTLFRSLCPLKRLPRVATN